MMAMQLTPNFSLREFTRSQTAERYGIDNTPQQKFVENLTILAANILQPLREHFGQPVRITSGYRCPELNRRLGGAEASQHTLGLAADIKIRGVSNLAIAEWIRCHCSYHQLILEHWDPARGKSSGWVHVSTFPEPSLNKRRLLVASKDGRRTVYRSVTTFAGEEDRYEKVT